MYKLPVIMILAKAFVSPWVMRKEMFSTLSISILVLISIPYIQWYLDMTSFSSKAFFSAWSLLAYAFLAVTCHRIVLMGQNSVPSLGIRKWTMRETRFAGWLIGLYLLVSFAILLVSLVSNLIFTLIEDMDLPFVQIIFLFAVIPGVYLLARFSMIFPATAVDERPDVKWAWDLSSGNGWRLVIIVSVLPAITKFILVLLSRENSYLLEDLALALLSYVVLVIEIAAISLSYKELTNNNHNAPGSYAETEDPHLSSD